MLILLFVIIAAVATGLYFAFVNTVFWQLLLVFLGVFLGENILFVLFFYLASLGVDRSKPLEKQNKLCRAACAQIIGLACDYCSIRAKIVGEEKLPKDERFLLISNHRSSFDPLIIMDKLRKYNISFISKPSNMELPVAGRIAYGAGFLAIDRENNRNALKTILQAADYLKRDLCSMAIYPEGTRNRGEGLLPFHAGSFKIAQKAGCPLVITAVSGTENIKPWRIFGGNKIKLNILEVIPAEKVKEMSTAELADYSCELITKSLSKEN